MINDPRCHQTLNRNCEPQTKPTETCGINKKSISYGSIQRHFGHKTRAKICAIIGV